MEPRDNSRPGPDRRSQGRRGIALLSVLWVLMLLGLMAATFTRTTRSETQLARNLLENAKAEALADAGLHVTAAMLLQPVTAGGWSIDGQVRAVSLSDGEFRATIVDEAGKIDINHASADLLRALFVAVGMDGQDAGALADAVVDFRDPDHLHGLNGAEDDAYRAADMGHDAKDSPFEAVDELKQVIGMPAELYQKIAPVLTVHTRQRLPSEATAPPLVVAALSGQTLEETEQQEAHPAPQTLSVDQLLSQLAPSGGSTDPDEGIPGPGTRSRLALYAIHVEGRTPSGAVYARDAVVSLAGVSGPDPQVFEWRQGRAVLFGGVEPEEPDLDER